VEVSQRGVMIVPLVEERSCRFSEPACIPAVTQAATLLPLLVMRLSVSLNGSFAALLDPAGVTGI